MCYLNHYVYSHDMAPQIFNCFLLQNSSNCLDIDNEGKSVFYEQDKDF